MHAAIVGSPFADRTLAHQPLFADCLEMKLVMPSCPLTGARTVIALGHFLLGTDGDGHCLSETQ